MSSQTTALKGVSPALAARMKSFQQGPRGTDDRDGRDGQNSARRQPSPRRAVSPRLRERVDSFERPGKRKQQQLPPPNESPAPRGPAREPVLRPRGDSRETGRTPVRTGTPWTPSVTTFSGVSTVYGKDSSPPRFQHLPINGQTPVQKAPAPLVASVTAKELGVKAPTLDHVRNQVQPSHLALNRNGASTITTTRDPNEDQMNPQRAWLASMISAMSDRGGALDSDTESAPTPSHPNLAVDVHSHRSSPLVGELRSPVSQLSDDAAAEGFTEGVLQQAATEVHASVQAMNDRRMVDKLRRNALISDRIVPSAEKAIPRARDAFGCLGGGSDDEAARAVFFPAKVSPTKGFSQIPSRNASPPRGAEPGPNLGENLGEILGEGGRTSVTLAELAASGAAPQALRNSSRASPQSLRHGSPATAPADFPGSSSASLLELASPTNAVAASPALVPERHNLFNVEPSPAPAPAPAPAPTPAPAPAPAPALPPPPSRQNADEGAVSARGLVLFDRGTVEYPPRPPNAVHALVPLPLPVREVPPLQPTIKVDTQTSYSTSAPDSARPQLDVTITLELPSLSAIWRHLVDRGTSLGVDNTPRSHESDISSLLHAHKTATAFGIIDKSPIKRRKSGGQEGHDEEAEEHAQNSSQQESASQKLKRLRPYGTQLPEVQRADVVMLAREMRRFERLRSTGLDANKSGDHRMALRALHQAALIKPSCAMLLSVANMHMKLNHPTLAAPLYYAVLTSSRASEKEKNMAAAKVQVANAKARERAGLPALGTSPGTLAPGSPEQSWTAPRGSRAELRAELAAAAGSPTSDIEGATRYVNAGGIAYQASVHAGSSVISSVIGDSLDDRSTIEYASSRSPTKSGRSSYSSSRTPSSYDQTQRTLAASTCRTPAYDATQRTLEASTYRTCASGSTTYTNMPYNEPGGPPMSISYQKQGGARVGSPPHAPGSPPPPSKLVATPTSSPSVGRHTVSAAGSPSGFIAWGEVTCFDGETLTSTPGQPRMASDILSFFEDEDGNGLIDEMLDDPDLSTAAGSPEAGAHVWRPAGGWLKPGGGVWPVLSKEWKRAVQSLPTLQGVLDSFPQLDARWQARNGQALMTARGEPLLQHDPPLRTVRFVGGGDAYALLPSSSSLGFDHLQMYSEAGVDCLLSLLLSGLHASGATVHVAPCIGWSLIGKCEGWTPSEYEADELGPLPLGAPASLCIWQPKGVSLVHLFCPPPGELPFDFSSLYQGGLTPPPPDRSPKPPPPLVAPLPDSARPLASMRSMLSDGTPIPGLSLWRLKHPDLASASLASAAAQVPLPPPPATAAEAFGDFALFTIAHTIALLQAALELQHNDLNLGHVQLLPASEVTHRGVPLVHREVLVYEWGEYRYAFRTPAMVPVITGLSHASARLDGVLIDSPAPTLQPAFNEALDLAAFWKKARSQVRCGELVRRRLHALVIQGAQYDVRTADPWEQYRLPNQGVSSSGGGASAALVASAWQELSERESVAALQAEWMPEAREGRDCSCQLLTRLRSDALLTLRDRARAQQKEGSGSYSSGTSRPRPTMRGQASAEVLQDLYLRAKVREAEEANRRETLAKEERALRRKLASLTKAERVAACANGWDGLQEAFEMVLSKGMWARAVCSVPDDWEEQEAIDAFCDLLQHPETSKHVGLLLDRDDT